MATALFTGTFDPLHGGHIGQILRAHHAVPLSKVLILVNKQPSHKPNASSWQHRLNMAELTMNSFDLPFEYIVSSVENAFASEISETVDYKIVGIDSLVEDLGESTRWELAVKWPLIVLSIPGINIATLDRAVQALPDAVRQQLRYAYVSEAKAPMMNYDFDKQSFSTQRVHATQLRSGTNKAFIPPKVQDYIQAHHLYS